jgi:hypothetical protein
MLVQQSHLTHDHHHIGPGFYLLLGHQVSFLPITVSLITSPNELRFDLLEMTSVFHLYEERLIDSKYLRLSHFAIIRQKL